MQRVALHGTTSGPGATASTKVVDAGAMRMQYTVVMFKAVRYSDWSADHIAAHGVSMDEVREAILQRPYWAARCRDETTPIDTEAEKKTFRRKA
jgi:hypothetical protein